MNRFAALRKRLSVALGALLLTLLLAALWRTSDASTAMDRLFQSALQPTATTAAHLPATVAPTATTRGGRAAPTATPAARVLNAAYIRRLPLVLKGWPPTPTPTATATPTRTATPTATPTPTPIKYGWKGIADPSELSSATTANGFWGLNPSWYYNWGYGGPWAAAHGAQAQSSAVIAAQLAAALADPAYVPMIWCTDEVVSGISPETAAGLARAHPGRVWLIFNEADQNGDGDNCGTAINQHYPDKFGPGTGYYDGLHWPQLGEYLAKQYIRYYDALKAADPTARFFPLGGLYLTSAPGSFGQREQQIWYGFTSYLANPTAEPEHTPRPLNGIAIHAYPNFSAGCGIADAYCLQQALISTHNFYQTANPTVTAAKPIWITEIGNLAAGGSPPGAPQGRPTAQAYTATVLTQPLLTWFAAQAVPGGSVPYFNGLAWFSTHDCRRNPDGSIKDNTASDLLDIGPVACPITTQPPTQQRTVIGQAWAAAACATCACPGPDCP